MTQFTRRNLLQAGSAFSLNAVAPSLVRAQETADVIVIGAGLSGLNAAWILTEAGYRVIVLEGDTRLGGRARTAEDIETKPELGASQVGLSYARVLDAIDRLDLETSIESLDLMPMAYHLSGAWISPDDWPNAQQNTLTGDDQTIPPSQLSATLMARHNPLQAVDDWLEPDFAEYDVSLGAYWRSQNIPEDTLRLAGLGGPGAAMWDASALTLFQEAKRGDVENMFQAQHMEAMATEGKRASPLVRNIKHGTSRLPEAMAAQLNSPVRLSSIAAEIEMDATGADVRTLNGDLYRAKFIISSVPFAALRNVTIRPAPPPSQNKAIRTLGHTETFRVFVSIREPFWEQDGLGASMFSDSALRTFFVLNSEDSLPPYQGVFVIIGKAGLRLASLNPADVSKFVLDELAKVRPASKGKVDVLTWHSWARQPLIGGCRHMFAPGQVSEFANAMRQPWERLHFCGEHTRISDYGMESAFETGERAALEVLDRIA